MCKTSSWDFLPLELLGFPNHATFVAQNFFESLRKKLNSMSEVMLSALQSNLDDIAKDRSIRVVILKGKGKVQNVFLGFSSVGAPRFS